MTQQAAAEPPATTTFNILFVCTGNTCRSPLAEQIARDELAKRAPIAVPSGTARPRRTTRRCTRGSPAPCAW